MKRLIGTVAITFDFLLSPVCVLEALNKRGKKEEEKA
jgi:hypothetical protein